MRRGCSVVASRGLARGGDVSLRDQGEHVALLRQAGRLAVGMLFVASGVPSVRHLAQLSNVVA